MRRGGAQKHSVTVSVRVRPAGTPGSSGAPSTVYGVHTGGEVRLMVSGSPAQAPGDVIEGSDQEQAWRVLAAPLIERLGEGYSCCLVAYGQTGSGKTHTMFGPPGALTEASLREVRLMVLLVVLEVLVVVVVVLLRVLMVQTRFFYQVGRGEVPALWGVMPRTMKSLLEMEGVSSIHASAVEVYMESAYDLLASRAQLKVGAAKTSDGYLLKDPCC